jgi:hypothetical protein
MITKFLSFFVDSLLVLALNAVERTIQDDQQHLHRFGANDIEIKSP